MPMLHAAPRRPPQHADMQHILMALQPTCPAQMTLTDSRSHSLTSVASWRPGLHQCEPFAGQHADSQTGLARPCLKMQPLMAVEGKGSMHGRPAASSRGLTETGRSPPAGLSHLCGVEGQVLHYVSHSLLLFSLDCRAHAHCQRQGCPLLWLFAGAHKVSAGGAS